MALDEDRLPERHADAPASGEPIRSHYHLCVACGDDHPTGLHLQVTAGPGLTVQARFTVTADHQGAPGLAHGGILSMAMDDVLGSLVWLVGEPAVTAHLQTDYRRPVPVGTTLHLDARLDRRSGSTLWMSGEGRADAPDGPVAVEASAVFVIVDLTHFVEHGRTADVAAAVGHQAGSKPSVEINP